MQKRNCSDYKQTTKQDNKEINKQAINASLLPLLHILHPPGIKVRHQCKYREQSSILHTLGHLNWPPVQINAVSKQVHNWNNFRRAQESLSWVSTMLAISLAILLALSCLALKSSNACYCTRKYAFECSRDFRSPSASCRSTADRCLSACSWDWRNQTESDSVYVELLAAVVARNLNTTPRQDFGVVSLSSR